MSYTTIITSLEALVTSISGPFTIYPTEILENVDDDTYVIFDLIFSAGERGDYSNTKVDGSIQFTIVYPFTSSKRQISSYCETYLQPVFANKVISTAKLQTFTPALQFIRVGANDNTKLRAEYSVPFKYIGE